MSSSSPVAIVGAGPYALSLSSFLRRAGVEHRIFGELMGFWRAMPAGMSLRSFRKASSIADPERAFDLDGYEASIGRAIRSPIPLSEFIEYGRWFAAKARIDLESRRVTRLTRTVHGFELALDDGETCAARRVVLAAGIAPFAWVPPVFEELPASAVSHSSMHRDYRVFAGQSVLVVGAGQSALEAAVFLREAGAATELLVRRPTLRFLRGESFYESAGLISRFFYPEWGVGPPVVNWLMGRPSLYRRLPSRFAEPLASRAIRPAGSSWLQPRLDGVRVTTGRHVHAAANSGSVVRVTLDDGSTRTVDHVVLGTGYRIDLRRYCFMDPDLVRAIDLKGSSPRLTSSLESSVEGLYFVGAPAAASAGPGFRFVSHSGFAAKAITRHLLRDRDRDTRR